MLSSLTRAELLMLLIPIALFAIVFEMVRRRRLREDYSLLWLGMLAALIGLAFFRDTLLDTLANAMGIFYPPSALFVLGLGMVTLILLQFSVVISKLARQNQQAAQHIALLSTRVYELEQQLHDLDEA